MELRKLYLEDAEKHLGIINASLKRLKKDKNDKEAIKNMLRSLHTLKGNSLQMENYLVTYISEVMYNLLEKMEEGEVEIDEKTLVFLLDFTVTLDQAIDYIKQGKKFRISPGLFKKLDKICGREYKE